MARTRTVKLNSTDINRTIKALRRVRDSLTKSTEIEKALREAVNYCKSITPDKNINTYWEKTASGYRLVQEGDSVAFIEFGTGLVGQSHPHQNQEWLGKASWIYGSGEKQHETKNGRYGWVYPEDETGMNFKFTEGQPANMQMYQTALFLSHKLNQAVRLTIEKAVNKW